MKCWYPGCTERINAAKKSALCRKHDPNAQDEGLVRLVRPEPVGTSFYPQVDWTLAYDAPSKPHSPFNPGDLDVPVWVIREAMAQQPERDGMFYYPRLENDQNDVFTYHKWCHEQKLMHSRTADKDED